MIKNPSKNEENNNILSINNVLYENVGHETNQRLSENIKITFNTYKSGLGSMNTLVIGGTGEGKSRYIVRPIVYSMPTDSRPIIKKDKNGNEYSENPKMSFVFTDPKGELCRDTAGVLKACGYEIKIFNLVNMEYSDCYNPFKYVKDDTAITILIDGLVDTATGGSQSKDPHWGNMAKALLNSLAFYVFYELPASRQNFTTLSKLVPLFSLEEGATRCLFDDLLDKALENSPLGILHPAKVWRDKITATGGELSSIVSTANSALRLWADISVQKMTEVDTLELDKIGDRPTAVYVITPTTNSTYDFLVATFYNQLFETLMYKANMVYHGGLPHHVLVVQDEFANTGKIPDYDKKIATFRSCNISSIIIVQSPNQIESMYEGKAQDIIDNTHIQIFLGNGGIGDKSAPVWVSKALGKTTVKSESYSLNYQKYEVQATVNSSIGNGERDLMTADEVRRLPATECLIMIKGCKPFRDKKIDLDSCLNFGSDIFTEKTERGRKLKKEFNYVIEENKETLKSYFLGKKDCKNIDLEQSESIKRVLVKNSDFASFERDYDSYLFDLISMRFLLKKLMPTKTAKKEYFEKLKNEKANIKVLITDSTKNYIKQEKQEEQSKQQEDEPAQTSKSKKNKEVLKQIEINDVDINIQAVERTSVVMSLLEQHAKAESKDDLEKVIKDYVEANKSKVKAMTS